MAGAKERERNPMVLDLIRVSKRSSHKVSRPPCVAHSSDILHCIGRYRLYVSGDINMYLRPSSRRRFTASSKPLTLDAHTHFDPPSTYGYVRGKVCRDSPVHSTGYGFPETGKTLAAPGVCLSVSAGATPPTHIHTHNARTLNLFFFLAPLYPMAGWI